MAHVLLRELLLLVEGEFLVLDSLLNGKCGPNTVLEVQILRVRAKCFGVNGGQVDLALVLLGEGLEGLCELCALFLCLCEDVAKGEFGLSRTSVAVNHSRSGLGLTAI